MKYRTRTERVLGYKLRHKRTQCKREGILFNLTAEYVHGLWQRQFGCCSLCGGQMFLEAKHRRNVYSIDQTKPSEGYVKGNVTLMHTHCNTKKNADSVKQVVNWARKVQKFHEK